MGIPDACHSRGTNNHFANQDNSKRAPKMMKAFGFNIYYVYRFWFISQNVWLFLKCGRFNIKSQELFPNLFW